MSEKARELIEEWVIEWERQKEPPTSGTGSGGKGRGKKGGGE
jgi:hypothetical protein